MKGLNEKIINRIVGGIVLIIGSIAIIFISITAIPYSIIRGVCNLDYYDEWVGFLIKHNPFSKLR